MKAMKAMKATKAMKAMKAMRARKPSATELIAREVKLDDGPIWRRPTAGEVRNILKIIFRVAVDQMLKTGKFNLAGMLLLKPKVVYACNECYMTNPATKRVCIVSAKPRRKTVIATPLIRLKQMITCRDRERVVVLG